MLSRFFGLFRRHVDNRAELHPSQSRVYIKNVGDLVDILMHVPRSRHIEAVLDGATSKTDVFCIDQNDRSVRIWSTSIADVG